MVVGDPGIDCRASEGQGMDQDTTDHISIAGPLPLTATPNHLRIEPVWPTFDPIERETLVARDRAEQPASKATAASEKRLFSR